MVNYSTYQTAIAFKRMVEEEKMEKPKSINSFSKVVGNIYENTELLEVK